MSDAPYTLADLCDLADVSPRTVRYYISQGLLRSPGTSGPGARYDDGHLARLRLIRRLQREHLPLAEIRARLAALGDDEAIAQAEGPVPEPRDSALDYVRGVLASPVAKPSGALPPGGTPPPGATPSSPFAPRPPRRDAPWPPQPRILVDRGAPSLLRRVEEAPPAAGPNAAPSPAAEPNPAPSPAAGPPVPDRSQWERYALAPDVELHVRRPLTRSQNRAVARLLEVARQLLEEDQP